MLVLAIIADLHSSALREVASATGERYQGLRSAAGALRRRGLITNKLSKQICRVDDTHAILRHIDVVKSAMLLDELSYFLSGLQQFEERRCGDEFFGPEVDCVGGSKEEPSVPAAMSHGEEGDDDLVFERIDDEDAEASDALGDPIVSSAAMPPLGPVMLARRLIAVLRCRLLRFAV